MSYISLVWNSDDDDSSTIVLGKVKENKDTKVVSSEWDGESLVFITRNTRKGSIIPIKGVTTLEDLKDLFSKAISSHMENLKIYAEEGSEENGDIPLGFDHLYLPENDRVIDKVSNLIKGNFKTLVNYLWDFYKGSIEDSYVDEKYSFVTAIVDLKKNKVLLSGEHYINILSLEKYQDEIDKEEEENLKESLENKNRYSTLTEAFDLLYNRRK